MLPSLLAALALSAPVPKAPPIDLSWKFTKGDVFYVTHDHIVTTERDYGNGYYFDMVYAMTVVAQVTVTSSGPKQTVLTIKFVGGKYGAADMTCLLKQTPIDDLAGKQVTVTLDADRRIREVEGAEQVAEGKDPTANGALLESTIRQMLNAMLWAVPGKTLAEGDTWAADRKDVHSDNFTSLEQSECGTVLGAEDGLTRLSAKVDVAAWVTRSESHRSELAGTGGLRTVAFDAKAGRVRSAKEKVTMEGELKPLPTTNFIPPRESKLRWTQTIKITVSDEKPKAKK